MKNKVEGSGEKWWDTLSEQVNENVYGGISPYN